MDSLTVSSLDAHSLGFQREITPAMVAVLWMIAHELDRLRVPENYGDAKWLEIPSEKLTRPRRKTITVASGCLDRLMGVKLGGEYRGDPWGAVMVAQNGS